MTIIHDKPFMNISNVILLNASTSIYICNIRACFSIFTLIICLITIYADTNFIQVESFNTVHIIVKIKDSKCIMKLEKVQYILSFQLSIVSFEQFQKRDVE
jgi:hypothetical protein